MWVFVFLESGFSGYILLILTGGQLFDTWKVGKLEVEEIIPCQYWNSRSVFRSGVSLNIHSFVLKNNGGRFFTPELC